MSWGARRSGLLRGLRPPPPPPTSPGKSMRRSSLHVCSKTHEFRKLREAQRGAGHEVGFVPTMGALHEGHLQLCRRALQENAWVAASVFVNPGQFAPGEDLDRYPRQQAADRRALGSLGVDALFSPDVAELYPSFRPGLVGVHELLKTLVVPQGSDSGAEGGARPGFFTGVSTVCCKLFNIVQPTRAYFGQKDGMQCIVLRNMVRDLDMPMKVVVCPTVREADGLAMSSRNVYLSQRERAAAPTLRRALLEAEQLYCTLGERRRAVLLAATQAVLEAEPAFRVEYVCANEAQTGLECKGEAVPGVSEGGVMISAAVNFGSTRILDNVFLPNLQEVFGTDY